MGILFLISHSLFSLFAPFCPSRVTAKKVGNISVPSARIRICVPIVASIIAHP